MEIANTHQAQYGSAKLAGELADKAQAACDL